MNRILIWPHLQLEQPAARVEVINEETVGPLFDELAATMYHAKGIGIAAPQVGLPLRLVVIDVDGERLDMVNPEVVEVLGRQAESREGCLSIPGQLCTVVRWTQVWGRWFDRHGAEQERTFTGLHAQAFQHELDHLDGKVIADRTGPVARDKMRRKMRPLRQRFAHGWDPRVDGRRS